MRYSESFENDFNWYLSVRHQFRFDGALDYVSKKGEEVIVDQKHGVDGKRAFYEWDSRGKILPTRHPNLLRALLKTKGSVNLHIKAYAEDRARGYLPKIEFESLCEEINAPAWFVQAVENQKSKYY